MSRSFRTLLIAALGLTAACSYDPAYEATCTDEGARSDGRLDTGEVVGAGGGHELLVGHGVLSVTVLLAD